MLKIEKISKSFNNKIIIRQLSLNVAKGERICIIGPSGCGKSTILKCILNLLTPETGKIFFEGTCISELQGQALQQVRSRIGLLFQHSALFDSLTVKENVAFSLLESNTPPPQKTIDHLVEKNLNLVGMLGFENAMPADLSGGQKKRIGLARALTENPKIMLFDEPTTGLDPVLSRSIENLIVKLSRSLNMTTIVVTHQFSTMLRTADKIYFMHNGILLAPESPESIQKSKNEIIRRFINGET